MSKTLVVIPARFASTRFPGKPLALLNGKPMIQHVWENSTASLADRVIVATEDERIVETCAKFGARAVMTDPDLPSGTDRVAEAARGFPEYDVILNVQGDEPAMESSVISAVTQLAARDGVEIATAVVPEMSEDELANPNVVKAVVAGDGRALYFSRSPIPYVRNTVPNTTLHYRHLGIYGFKRETLFSLVKLERSALEISESLEQLRWLEAGYSIFTTPVQSRSIGIDTPEDMAALQNRYP
jgi:3-deoxy-manno-octulosonate cytidylyltransferase (CMP-KDO synthetase)